MVCDFGIDHHTGQILNMVDLVHAVLNALNGIHAEWDVAGYGHSQAVRFSGNNFQNVRLHRAIDFDLLKAGGFVFLHLLARLLRRVHANHAQRERPAAIHHARHHQPGPYACVLRQWHRAPRR